MNRSTTAEEARTTALVFIDIGFVFSEGKSLP
jgi:hypothetical protein